MAIVSKITGGMIAKGKGVIDYYMLRGILPVARSWPKRRETPFRPRELEAQGVFGILSKSTTFIQDKVREAWIVESIGKRPRWQDTYIGLGMKYWGINGEIPPILLDYQIHWHSPNPELELLLQKIEDKFGKTEAQEIQTTGIISLADIETYREKLYFTIYDMAGLRLIAPFLEFIIGKNIDFLIELQKLAGFIDEPVMKVCFSDANVRIPKKKTYYYHGVKFDCVIEINPKPHKCIPIERKEQPYKQFTVYGTKEKSVGLYFYQENPATPVPSYPEYLIVRNSPVANQDIPVSPDYSIGLQVGQWCSYDPPIQPFHSYHVLRTVVSFKNYLNIPEGAPIQYARIDIKPYRDYSDVDFYVVVQNGQPDYPRDPVVLEDYDKENYSGIGGSIHTSELELNVYNSIVFNALGASWINVTSDLVAKLCLRSSRDIEGLIPTGAEYDQRITFYNKPYSQPRLNIRVTLAIPKAKTQTTTDIEKNSARFNGTITFLGWWIQSYGFEYKEGAEGLVIRVQVGGANQYVTDFSKLMTNLEADTGYYVRAWGENGAGIGRGAYKYFKTKA